jgi:hypothetical protein
VTTARKPLKVYRATLRDEPGSLTKLASDIVFFNDDTGAIVTIEPDDCVWLCVLGETGLADTQRIMDVIVHGGYAAIACARLSEVA